MVLVATSGVLLGDVMGQMLDMLLSIAFDVVLGLQLNMAAEIALDVKLDKSVMSVMGLRFFLELFYSVQKLSFSVNSCQLTRLSP